MTLCLVSALAFFFFWFELEVSFTRIAINSSPPLVDSRGGGHGCLQRAFPGIVFILGNGLMPKCEPMSRVSLLTGSLFILADELVPLV